MRVPSVPSPVVGLAKGPQRAYLDLSGATAWDISPVGRRGNLDLMQYALIFFDVQLILAQMPHTHPRIVPTRGRRRQVDTSTHFCPNPACAYRGWAGWGNLRANGHPNGGPWRQLLCVACRGYFLETLGTLFHGKRASVELIVRVIACLAEGLGIRGTARVFEVDPNTVLQWLVEAAEQLRAFSQHFLHDVRVRQVQLDELFALLSAVKNGEVSEAAALERLDRSPHWVWAAMDPESKLLLVVEV